MLSVRCPFRRTSRLSSPTRRYERLPHVGGDGVKLRDRQVGDEVSGPERWRLIQHLIPDRRPHQQVQRVLVLCDLPDIGRAVGPRRLHSGARLRHVELSADTPVEAARGQVVGLLLSPQRILRQLQQFLVRQQRQIGVGNLGDQRNLGRDPRLIGREEAFQRRLLKASDPAEQVKLV